MEGCLMCHGKCLYCKKYFKDLSESKRCNDCEEQFKEIVAGITKRYAGALKNLADR